MRLRRAPTAPAVLVVLAAAIAAAPPATAAGARVTKLDCRGACFAFAELSCAAVETDCGKYQGIFVLGGLPFACEDVEPVACHLGVGDALAACLAVCGGEDYPYLPP